MVHSESSNTIDGVAVKVLEASRNPVGLPDFKSGVRL
jgi:hypothetical protein